MPSGRSAPASPRRADVCRSSALVERVARDNGQAQSLVDLAQGAVYLSINRYDEGIALRRRAALDPSRPGMKVDLAVALLEYRRDVGGAREQLRARAAFDREAATVSLEGLFLWTDPFLCLALAQSGQKDRARAMLPRVTRYLEAMSRPEWLERCREALGT